MRMNELWYALPLIVVISLVYSGTRYERPEDILLGSFHSAKWIIGFMVVIFAILWFVSWLAS
ncbi:MAG: hypothetical protein K8U03_01605 [Planctomycetia bacterium]|nr:hypothetical protein [Planctomycetia bacterium]